MKGNIDKKSIFIIIGVLLIPLIYSFFYLKSYWDPFGNMNKIPVAIVNKDNGVNGINKGTILINKLLDKDVLNIKIVSEDQAKKGLINKKFYGAIIIPENFTLTVNSATSDNIQNATIEYIANEKSNYLASQLIEYVISEVHYEINLNIGFQVISNVSDNLREIPTKLNKISSQANTLKDESIKAEKNSLSLTKNIDLLSTSYDSSNEKLININKGSVYLTSSTSDLKYKSSNLINNISSLNNYISSINPEDLSEIDLLYFSEALDSLEMDADDLNNALEDIKSSAFNLNHLINSLSNDSANITRNIVGAQDGAKNLDEKVKSILNNIDEQNNNIKNSVDSTKSVLNKIKGIDNYNGNLVSVSVNNEYKVNNLGNEFVSYLMPLALWIGNLILLIFFYYDPLNRFKTLSKNTTDKVKRNIYYLGLSASEAIIMGIFLKITFDLKFVNTLNYILSLILISMTFLVIIMFLIKFFNDLGKFIAVILFILQLTSSGSIFPIETAPLFFRIMHNILPLKYASELLKEWLISVNTNSIFVNGMVLIGMFSILFLAIIIKETISEKNKLKTALAN